MSSINSLAKDLYDIINDKEKKGPKPSEPIAEVVKVDDDVVWVRLPGSVGETPVEKTMDANVGNKVRVRLSGGRAWIIGNMTVPPTGDTVAKQAMLIAKGASDHARKAVEKIEEMGEFTPGEFGIVAIWYEYNMSTSNAEFIQAQGYDWSEEIPEFDSNYFIWKRTVYEYADGRVVYGDPEFSSQDQALAEVKLAQDSTNNHFWHDESGAYVTEDDEDYTTGYATRTTAAGILQTHDNKLMASWTNSGMIFYQSDGETPYVTYGANGIINNPTTPFTIGNNDTYMKWVNEGGRWKLKIQADAIEVAGNPVATDIDIIEIEDIEYAYQLSESGTDIPTGTWSSTPVAPTVDEYAWTRTTVIYSDGQQAVSYTVGGKGGAVGPKGETGEQGPKGDKGDSITITRTEYGLSESASTAPSSWATSVPTSLPQGIWLWIKTTFNDGSSTTTKSYMGTDGSDGKSVYVKSVTKSGDRTTVILSDGTNDSTLNIDDGQDGDNGTPGASGYVHVAWATSADGSQGFSTSVSANKTYLGVYTDSTEADSQNYRDYSWSLIKGAKGEQGDKGDKGDKGDTGSQGPQGPQGNGVSITNTSVTYASSSSGTSTPSSSSFGTSVPSVSPGNYLWTRTIVTYSDNTSTTSYSVARQGANGTDITSQYVTYTSSTGVTVGYNNVINAKVNIKGDGVRIYNGAGNLGTYLDSNGMHVYDGSTLSNEVATFTSSAARVGNINSSHTTVTSSGLDVYSGSETADNTLAQIHSDQLMLRGSSMFLSATPTELSYTNSNGFLNIVSDLDSTTGNLEATLAYVNKSYEYNTATTTSYKETYIVEKGRYFSGINYTGWITSYKGNTANPQGWSGTNGTYTANSAGTTTLFNDTKTVSGKTFTIKVEAISTAINAKLFKVVFKTTISTTAASSSYSSYSYEVDIKIYCSRPSGVHPTKLNFNNTLLVGDHGPVRLMANDAASGMARFSISLDGIPQCWYGLGTGGTNHGIYSVTNGAWIIYVNSSGQTFLPIAGAEDTTTSAVNCRLEAGGHIHRYSSSSRRYKHDIKPISSDELNPHKLYDLQVVEFVYNDGYLEKDDKRLGSKIPGFIAEEVHKCYPIAVDYDNDQIEDWNARYIIPSMLKLIQEQHDEIEMLKTKVEILENGTHHTS